MKSSDMVEGSTIPSPSSSSLESHLFLTASTIAQRMKATHETREENEA